MSAAAVDDDEDVVGDLLRRLLYPSKAFQDFRFLVFLFVSSLSTVVLINTLLLIVVLLKR